MAFTAYFDASGTHAGSLTVGIGGYLATQEQWEIFGQEWERALREWHIPYFHMADYESRKSYFATWTNEQRHERLATLFDIINQNVMQSISVSVLMSDYDAVDAPSEKNIIGGAYGLVATGCYAAIGDILKDEADDAQVAYVFESGDQGAGAVQQSFLANYRVPVLRRQFRLLSIRFEDKRQFAPLQAADILAYEAYKGLPRQSPRSAGQGGA